MRPGVALIYMAMAVISASIAAILHRVTGFPLETSIMLAAVIFFALCAIDQAVSRASDRKTFQNQLELSDHSIQDAMNEIDMIRSRLVSLETDTQQAVDAGLAPVQQDLQAVGALLSQVTEAVSDVDHRLATLEVDVDMMAKARAQPVASQPSKTSTAQAPPKPSAKAAPPEKAEKKTDGLAEERAQALKRRVTIAVEKERYEIALQSIVTLPLRKARGYSVEATLILDGVGKLEPHHAQPAVDAAGLNAEHDKALVLRAFALAHKFAARDSASIVFVPISGAALAKNRFADWLVNALSNNQELAGQLVIEFMQKDVRTFSPIEFDMLQSMMDLGFRMSLTHLTDAKTDVFGLARYGFRYAKAPASLFLGSENAANSDIHPEDLADLAARNGMDLIVDKVDSESQVVELLDYKLKYGQGNLFARPRVVEVEPHPEAVEQDQSAGASAAAESSTERPVARALSKAV